PRGARHLPLSRALGASPAFLRLPQRLLACEDRTVTRSDLPTARVQPAPVALVIGCPPRLVRRCRDAAIAAQTLVVDSEVASAATLAAATRPLAIVVLEDVYAFDPVAFNQLASDVRARLVLLSDEDVADDELEAILVGAIGEAEANRDSFA